MQHSPIGLPLRIVISVVATITTSVIAVALAVSLPLLLALVLPPSYGIYTMYLLVFFTALGSAMLGNLLYEKYRWFGVSTFMTVVIVGSFATTILTLRTVRDVFLPQALNVEVTTIATTTETLVQPLPFSVVADAVTVTRETFHRAKYSRHQCTYTYVMPLCSVADGCNGTTWLAGTFTENIGVTEDCSDQAEPDWRARANTTWLRTVPASDTYANLAGGDGTFLTPTPAPAASLQHVFAPLLSYLHYLLVAVGALFAIELTAIMLRERKSSHE